jgi:hypothetical protein
VTLKQRCVFNAVPRPYFVRPKVLIIPENNIRTEVHEISVENSLFTERRNHKRRNIALGG